MKDTDHRNICRPTNTYRWYMLRTPRTTAPTVMHLSCLGTYSLLSAAGWSSLLLISAQRHPETFWCILSGARAGSKRVLSEWCPRPACIPASHTGSDMWGVMSVRHCKRTFPFLYLDTTSKKTETCIVVTKKCNKFISVILIYVSIFWIQVCSQNRPLVEHTE